MRKTKESSLSPIGWILFIMACIGAAVISQVFIGWAASGFRLPF